MPKLTIDGKEVEVAAGTTILEACHKAGADVPHFCWHPGLPNAANCRMCLVRVEKMPKPVPACNLPITEGMVVTASGPSIDPLRKSVLEFLLINHPLDCPICDKAGECMLQDNYYRYSREPSVMKDPKVHKPKKIDVNDRIIFDGERCILCSRCVRFSEDVSKTKQIGIEDRGDHCLISFPVGKKMDDPYSDNVVDICPVGALTSKKFRFQARVWNLRKTDSVCTGCSRNCNISVESKNNRVFRVLPKYRKGINDYWMCNFGRDYMSTTPMDFRIKEPRVRQEKDLVTTGWEPAVALFADLSSNAKSILVIGSRYWSNQEWWALKQTLPNAHVSLTTERKKDDGEVLEDQIYIRADKHPNSYTAEKMMTHKWSDIQSKLGDYDLVILGAHDYYMASDAIDLKKCKKLIHMSPFRDEFAEHADLVLPVATSLEKDGTFTNCDGKNSSFKKAIDLVPSGKSVDVILKNVAKFLGRNLNPIPANMTDVISEDMLPLEEVLPNVVNAPVREGYLFHKVVETPQTGFAGGNAK